MRQSTKKKKQNKWSQIQKIDSKSIALFRWEI